MDPSERCARARFGVLVCVHVRLQALVQHVQQYFDIYVQMQLVVKREYPNCPVAVLSAGPKLSPEIVTTLPMCGF